MSKQYVSCLFVRFVESCVSWTKEVNMFIMNIYRVWVGVSAWESWLEMNVIYKITVCTYILH